MNRILKQIFARIILIPLALGIIWPIYTIGISGMLLVQFLKELWTLDNVRLEDVCSPKEMWNNLVSAIKDTPRLGM